MCIRMRKNMARIILLTIILCLIPLISSLSHASTFGFTAFGPKTFIRKTGKPVFETASFTLKSPDTTYTLYVYNGGINSEYKKVSSAVVILNCTKIFDTNDFKQQVSVLKKEVNVRASNKLQVKLMSSPGSALTVVLEGTDETLPDITITSPEDDALHNTPSITVTGNATDSISWIKSVTVNGTSTGLTGESYTSDIQLTEGQNSITAMATDAAGNTNTATVTVTLDTTPPAVASTTPVDNDTDVSVNTAITATFSEDIDASTITTTTFTLNSETSGTATVSGSVTYSDRIATFTPSDNLSYNTTYTVTVKSGNNGVKDLAGNSLTEDYTWSFITESGLEINITEPQDGETINKAYAMVKGTIKTATNDIGIKVNGIIAEINGEDWAASDIPLTSGDNTITAEAVDANGNTAQEDIAIHTDTAEQPITISVTPKSGIAPLSTTFGIGTEISGTITTYRIDFDGDGATDLEQATDEDITHTYDTQGMYYPTVVIEDSIGGTYTETTVINVLSKDEMDTLLKGKWTGMKEALENGDIEGALSYFAEDYQQLYRNLFTNLSAQMPQVAQDMAEIQLVSVKDNTAKYRIKKDKSYADQTITVTYHIYFAKDASGMWKIVRF